MEHKKFNSFLFILPLHLFFLLLFLLAWQFFRERLLMDSAYYIFHVVNNESFCIAHDRLVLAFSQILPLVGVKLGFSLKSILIIYSIGHVLFFYALFITTFYFLKDRFAGFALLAIQTVGILHSFFVPMFELYYGVGFLILFNSILRRCRFNISVLLLLGLLEILILFSHPMGFALFAFIILFNLSDNVNRDYKPHLFFGILFIGIFVFKSLHLSPYEQGKSDAFLNHPEIFLNFHYLIDLAKYLINGYWEVLVFFLIGSVYYLTQFRFKKLALVWSFFLGIVFIINSSYDGLATGRYMEQVYFPLVFISVIPFAYDVFPKPGMKLKIFLLFIFIAIISWRIFLIHRTASEIFVKHTTQMQRLINRCKELGGSKFVIDPFNTARIYSWGNWSEPVETLLLSAMENKNEIVTIAHLEDFEKESNQKLLTQDRYIFRLDEIFEDASLNPKYFHLENGYYTLLNLPKSLPRDLKEFRKNISINLLAKQKYKAGKSEHVNVEIQNRNQQPVYSWKENELFLSYHWFKNGEVYEWNGIKTLLEVDITDSHQQDIQLKMPEEKGRYLLSVDMIAKNKIWFEINSRLEVTVD